MRFLLLRPLQAPVACVVVGLLVGACGGGGGSGDNRPPSAAGCFFQYTGAPPPLLAGDDPLLPRQWHLRNEGQRGGSAGEDLRAIDAWPLGTKGAGVRVAVVDDAIETLHEDLFPNVVAVHNYRVGAAPDSAPLPCDSSDDHGTSVAGIVGARDGNGTGVAGVAPRVSLAAYNALATGFDADIADALRRDGDVTAIYNNSWGSNDNGVLNAAEAGFLAAIEQGIANGRNGKGSVYVFPAGNGGCYLTDRASGQCFTENSNFDGYVNHRGVIAVCPVDDHGRAPNYAEPGANVLVCGPTSGGSAGITTTAVQNRYRDDFSGTSASTPMVAGVAALMIAANPSLSWRDVRLILARSARKNDPGDAGWKANAAGLLVHPLFGFGTANAAAAVAQSAAWPSIGGSESLKACGPYSRGPVSGPFPLQIPDTRAAVSDTIVIGNECAISQIEFVEVLFTASHPYSGDLRVELLRPDTTAPVALLANEHLCNTDGDTVADDCGSYANWRFGSVRNLDETARGQWQLRVSDQFAADAGQWDAWRLQVWGR